MSALPLAQRLWRMTPASFQAGRSLPKVSTSTSSSALAVAVAAVWPVALLAVVSVSRRP
ncbi:hypothetical protein [Solidesulfovibrio sp. C21]|uniref:hypothetical protein n=1 Tax=Solidesulfovibrio sp. C21 TaxID=3398613 RepID=UPI0039FD731E